MSLKRSPAHPGMSLEEAITKTKLFYKNNKRYAVSRTNEDPAAYTSIGYGTANGAAKRALSTLLQFGLLEKLPGGDDSKVKISEAGFKIAAYDDDPERESLIAEAARKPKVFKELLAEFPDGLPASDPPLRTYLLNHDFNLDAIPPLIRDFRATVAFAKVYERGKMDVEEKQDGLLDFNPNGWDEDDKEEPEPSQGGRKGGGMTAAVAPVVPMVPQGMRSIPVPLGPDKQVIVHYPANMTKDDLEFFDQIWTLYKTKIIVEPPKAPAPPVVKLGPAMWGGPEFDQEVEVTGYLGEQDGRHYVSVKDSTAGVPLDEIHYDPKLLL